MTLFSTIVVGTDGSQAAHAAVRKAGEVAAASDSAVVHVVAGYRPYGSHEMAAIKEGLPEEFRSSLSSDLVGTNHANDAASILGAMDVNVEKHAVATKGTEAILDVADKIGADLIVVGSRGLGAGGRMLRGSVSTKVVHNAPCSVLIVHA